MKSFRFSFTFEHDTKPTKTVTGTVTASNPGTAFRKAFAAAWTQRPPYRATTYVVLLEPDGAPDPA
jgi:hypothetical protein